MMATFRLFPTAHWATENAQGIAVQWKKGNAAFFASLPEQLTWQQWHHLVLQGVRSLQKSAIFSGDLVAYQGTDRFTAVLFYCSALFLGAKVLMLNPAMTDLQNANIVQRLGVKKLFDDRFALFCQDLPPCSPAEVDFSAPATLTLTSGSSGEPKAVVHSLQNHLDNARGVCELMNFQSQHRWLMSLPLYHVSGQGILWRWLSVGATLVITQAKADFWQALSQVSHASLVPTQLQRYLHHHFCPPVGEQHFLLGGSHLPAELLTQAQSAQINTYAGYGMTEMASTVCAVKNENDNVGTPLRGRDIRLEKGEIWVRGAGLALGYWQNQQLVPLLNEQGWFATKDKGKWHQGKLHIIGRLDNQFISGGENIQPEQIEQVLLQSGLLEQAIVVPVADAEFGQRPVAVVQFHDAFSSQGVRSLQKSATSQLEKFRLPIVYLPLSNFAQQSGIKIARKALQQAVEHYLREQANG